MESCRHEGTVSVCAEGVGKDRGSDRHGEETGRGRRSSESEIKSEEKENPAREVERKKRKRLKWTRGGGRLKYTTW